MKKFIGLILFVVCISSLLCGCKLFANEKSLKDTAAEHLNLVLDNATVLEEWDTHGGFHGDGDGLLREEGTVCDLAGPDRLFSGGRRTGCGSRPAGRRERR